MPNVDYNINPSVRQGHAPPPPQAGVVHAQYNTPISMYSNKNVNDSFNQQADVMKNEFGRYEVSLYKNSCVSTAVEE